MTHQSVIRRQVQTKGIKLNTSIQKRKEREKEARRRTILTTAEMLFSQKGFHHVKMDEIAEKAGFSKGTLYLYFENKEMLFISIIIEKSKQLTEQLKRVIECHQEFEICLRNFIESTLRFFIQNRPYFKLLHSEKMSMTLEEHYKLHDYAKQSMDCFYQLITHIVTTGNESHYFKNFNKDVIAKSLRGLINSFLFDIICNEEKINIETTAYNIMDVFLYGVHASKK